MEYVAITLELPFHDPRFGGKISLDLDIPSGMPVSLFLSQALPAILQRKGLHQVQAQVASGRWLLVRKWQGHRLPILTHTFRGAGVRDGERLTLVPHQVPWPPYRYFLEQQAEDAADGDEEEAFTLERIYLARPKIRLGRPDWSRNHFVDVDLSVFPYGQRVSRRHAEIRFVHSHFVLRDLGSRNGTWVNGNRLRPKEDHVLHPGDRISFGKGLHFVFRDADQAAVWGGRA